MKFNGFLFVCVRILLIFALASSHHLVSARDSMVLGLIAPANVDETVKAWSGLAKNLEKALGESIEVSAKKSYADVLNGLEDGSIDIAWLNNRLAITAVEKGYAKVFAQMVRLDGGTGYKSILIAPKGGEVNSVGDVLKKKSHYRLGLGDSKSTSGYLVPSYYIFAKNKLDPQRHFRSIVRGSHRDNFEAVLNGKVDVAVNNTEDFALFLKESPGSEDKVKVVWESPLIPSDPILYRTDLEDSKKELIKSVFFTYGENQKERESLAAIKLLSGFRSSSNYQLRPVVDIELFNDLTVLMRESKLDKGEFEKKMELLTKRAAKLDTLLNASRFE